MASGQFSGSSELRDGAPGSGDLLPRRGREGVRAYPPRRPGLTVAQHLDQFAGAHRPLGRQALGGDVPAVGIELSEPPGVDDLVRGLEPRVGEASQLRHPAVQRHLAALEARRHRAAGPGALGAPAGRLALGPLTAAHPGPRRARTGGGAEVMKLQAGLAADGAATGIAAALARACHAQSTSSTVTRWRTAWIMPRNSGRSSLMTTWPIRFSPRERAASLLAPRPRSAALGGPRSPPGG